MCDLALARRRDDVCLHLGLDLALSTCSRSVGVSVRTWGRTSVQILIQHHLKFFDQSPRSPRSRVLRRGRRCDLGRFGTCSW
jgi:hypothetical protein